LPGVCLRWLPRLAPRNSVSYAKKLSHDLVKESGLARRRNQSAFRPSGKLTRKLTNVTNSSDYDDRRDASPAIRGQGAPVRAGQAGPPAASGSPLTRNGEPESVLLSADDLEGLEMTGEILGDTEAVARISESLAALRRGEVGAHLATVRQDLDRRCATGA
jgi:hypothetical protein